MFERKLPPKSAQNLPAQICQVGEQGAPVEFIYQGIRFHINQVLSNYLQTNQWWKEIASNSIDDQVSEQVSRVWQVEAAPIGAIATFEIEYNQSSKQWQIRSTSRSK
ncbi:MAG: hypothetical protein EBU41_05965 [Actinobacteria bacterium]|nr:hypothetical protein [Actinomycetota bacterium]NBQ60644.1 hypothetical protein [Actinomycetota bacterium]NBY82469.1 hypothetical protein [Actinomycetota bacterium]NDD78717.1 hypothetical protein [Actinomycetota bacterium]